MIQALKLRIKRFIDSAVSKPSFFQDTQVEQIQIANSYRLMKATLKPDKMPSLNEVGFRVHSQFEEDGILLYIFSIIGTTNKKVVEICAGSGYESMSANLIVNHGWHGLLFDGDENLVESGKNFFATNKHTWLCPPIFKQAWVTTENINQLIEQNGFQNTIDLLSLDIDGNDYHVMKSITIIKPRVIICETNNVIPDDKALTIPYDPKFSRSEETNIDFLGASLLAMKKLLASKNYRLIGAHRFGFNAVFMLNGIGDKYFPEVSIESVHDNAYTKHRQKKDWDELKNSPWVEV